MSRPKNAKEVKIPLSSYDFEGPLEGIEERLRSFIGDKECNDPILEADGWEPTDFHIKGWRQPTPAEIERSKKASVRKKEQDAKRKQQREDEARREYERLKVRFENV